MAIDTTPSTVATNALQAIPFGSLIGGPLNACIEAQATAAKTTYEFIKNVGFDANGKAKSVVFEYQRDGKIVNLTVPLLVIVPIPYIQVDTIGIDFMANISASASNVQENTSSESLGGELQAEGKIGWGPFSLSAKFKANYSSKKDSKSTQESKYSVEYTMNVHVGASQSNMPAGLAAVLNVLTGSLSGSEPGGELLLSPRSTAIADRGATGYFEITVKDEKGLLLPDQLVNITLTPASQNLKLLPMMISPGEPASGEAPTATQGKAKSDASGIIGVSIQIAPDSPESRPNSLKLNASTVLKTPDGKSGPVKTVTGQLSVTAQGPLPLPPGASLKVPDVPAGEVGEQKKFKATLFIPGKDPSGRTVKVRSDDPTVASVAPDASVVGSDGLTQEFIVTLNRAGTASLRVTCDEVQTQVAVTVNPITYVISATPDQVSVKEGQPAKITATLKDGKGVAQGSKPITAAVRDGSIATVTPALAQTNPSGEAEFTVTFHKVGETFTDLAFGDDASAEVKTTTTAAQD